MKTKLLAVMATLGMVASASAVKINNNLSINGFIDGSYVSTDDGDAVNDSSDIALDEVELNFLVNAGNVSGELHIDNTDGADELNIEQVHFSYDFGNGASVTVGRFGSALGIEREDPAGLYTFSRAYSDTGFDLGDVDDRSAQEGARLSYSAGDFGLSLALYDSTDAVLDDNGTKNDLDYELAISYNGIENLTVGAGIQSQRAETGSDDVEVYTINASYTLNKLLLAAEYVNNEEDGDGFDTAAYMVLADYDVNDKLGVAVRYSNWETGETTDSDKLTFAPNYAITDSLGAIVEFSAEEQSDGDEIDSVAIDLLGDTAQRLA